MNINQASQMTGVSKDMIRFYEKKGLIDPQRNKGNNYREYNDHDLNLIVMIHEYSTMGMSLSTIARLMKGQDIKAATGELEESIRRLRNEEMWIRARINSAVDSAKLLSMVRDEVPYEIGVRRSSYCYVVKNENFGNIHNSLADNGGIAHSVFRVRKENLRSDEWPEEHALLFTTPIEEFEDETEEIPEHRYFRTIRKQNKRRKIGYRDIESIIDEIKDIGYNPEGEVYIYQIMGSLEEDVEDLVCLEFDIGEV
ncbi:MerR family transcriptional regulator [Oribacterium sp. C9]|uniref:MerR family transcriptional regulator n=1 Tax=Oribacterium sp. C9 TaxID=1943579 RepID=UPI00198192A0|nr:MerR family transcriptional regulator [Oribacterium sp. C9]